MEYFDEKFKSILKNSKIFMMNQTSDMIEENKFNHVVFLGNTTIEQTLQNTIQMAANVNNVVQDKYVQLFVTREIFKQNYEIFKNDENGRNYTVVEEYADIFDGFVRVDKYFILANSSVINNRYNVYSLIDSNSQSNLTINNKNIKFDFYGFIKLGYIVNPKGYTDLELNRFENKMGFKLKDDVKKYVKTSSIIKCENKLFHINLDPETYSSFRIENLSKPFGYPGEKTISNIKFLSRYKSSTSDTEHKLIELEEEEYMDKTEYGFLYLGSLKKQLISLNDQSHLKSDRKIFLLLNYNTVANVNYDFSIWIKSYDNKNFDKILDKYDRDNYDEDEDESLEYDSTIFMEKDNIFQTLKCVENLSFNV